MQQAATDACSFVEGLAKEDFLEDKRTQQAVIMSLIIIGEAVTKVMDRYAEFTRQMIRYLGGVCAACVIASLMATLKSTLTWCGIPYNQPSQSYSSNWPLCVKMPMTNHFYKSLEVFLWET
uniref:HepT-like ribonuclease domain-containing protein n=1 Tax=Xylella fastidiosa TaxID=2371 RepID=UPI004063D8BE